MLSCSWPFMCLGCHRGPCGFFGSRRPAGKGVPLFIERGVQMCCPGTPAYDLAARFGESPKPLARCHGREPNGDVEP